MDGVEQRQPSPQEKVFLEKLTPRFQNMCTYMANEGMERVKKGHYVEDKISMEVDGKNIVVTFTVRKAD